MLTQAQIDFFNENGFLRVENVYSQAEIAKMSEDLAYMMDKFAFWEAGWRGDWRKEDQYMEGDEDAKAVLKVQDHVRFLYGGDTRLDSFQHAQIGNGNVPFAEISAMLHAADFRRPTILEIVADVADSAIDASVAYLDRIHWPAG